jgi:hypothetical protein
VVTSVSASHLPKGAKPMAAAMVAPHLYAALGKKLVVCDATCRVLDPGVAAPLEGVVPITATRVLLVYANERAGILEVPNDGGELVPDHPLAAEVRALLAARPARVP